IFGLFRDRFMDDKAGLLIEHFGPDWERSPEIGSGRFEPGHMVEWVWLLRRFERSTRRPVAGYCAALLARALRLGLQDGFLVDEGDGEGKPLIDRRRLWPQTEYLKALIVQATATGRPDLLADADELLVRIQRTYLAGVPEGAWCDQFTLAGRPSAANIP